MSGTRTTPSCGKPMRGFYGALSRCARPDGHSGPHYQVWDWRDWQDGACTCGSVEILAPHRPGCGRKIEARQ